MTRNGKIARLPYKIREEVNRRLRDNVPGGKICEWLNRLPAVRAVCREFAKRNGKEASPINEKQLSEWRRGGFQDWLSTQQMLEETREMTQWSMKLAKESGGELSEGAAVLLSVQLLKVLQGLGKFQVPSSKFQSRNGSAGGQSNVEGRVDDPGGEAVAGASSGGVSRPETGTGTVPEPAGGDACATYACSGEEDGMESTVRLLVTLVKCLSGIRRGDQNRVRLALSEKKLALRSKVVAITCEKYNKEKAAQEELERQERAEERRRKSGLSDKGKMHLLRGRMFGPEGVIKEREEELKRLQKDLKILKEKFGMSEDTSIEFGVRNSECGMGEEVSSLHPPSSDYGATRRSSKDQVPSSNAPGRGEPMSVNPSPSEQLDGKENGGLNMDDGARPVPAKAGTPNSATGRCDEPKASGVKKFDVDEMRRELNQIKEELAALQAELPVGESSPEPVQDAESKVHPPSSDYGATSSPNSNVAAGSEPEFSTLSWEEQTQWLKRFPEEALRKLEQIKAELAVLKAGRQAGASEERLNAEG